MRTLAPIVVHAAPGRAVALLVLAISACEPEVAPPGVGAAMGDESIPVTDSNRLLDNDMVDAASFADLWVPAPPVEGAEAEPRVFFLWYADGGPQPQTGFCGGGTPKKFECKFGSSVADCQKKVQAHLDKWYADFNIVFTLTKPSTAAYYIGIVASDGSFCPTFGSAGGAAMVKCGGIKDTPAFLYRDFRIGQARLDGAGA